MEVVKPKYKYQIECKNCGSLIKFNKAEVKYTLLFGDKFIVCPVCGKKVYIWGSLCWKEIE
ncbi:MAG: hypothetical protein J6Z11_12510 [Candidatus Riflebacteria bacterium]|nr:hypothetical protein [Candidatus Riflebacteria bacterium]